MSTQTFSPQAIPVKGPGPRAWRAMIVAEAKMVVRDTAGLVIPMGLPLLMLVVQVPMLSDVETDSGLPAIEIYALPVIFAMVIALVAVINMPTFLATYRRTKVLRRLAATPAHPAMVLAAQMVVSLIQVAIGIAAAYLVAVLFMDAGSPNNLGVTGLVLLATVAAMYVVGMVVASVAKTPNAASAIGLVAFFAMAALGGMFGPLENFPDALQTIGEWLPYGASVEAMRFAWIGESVDWQHWVSLVGTTVIGGSVAAALFRWE